MYGMVQQLLSANHVKSICGHTKQREVICCIC